MASANSRGRLKPSFQQLNHVFDLLDLLVVRITLLILLIIGAYTVIRGHL
jgi:hypothetical protein